LDANELARIWSAADKIDFPYGNVIHLLILTGQRRSEVGSMRWAELDFAKANWAIPAKRTKANRAHTLPLSDATVKILRQIPRVHDQLVFPALGKNHPISGYSKWKRQLDRLAQVDEWRLHDIRRTVASGMAELNIDPHIVELVLNHTVRGTLGLIASVYNRHPYLQEMRHALERWADYIAGRGIVKKTNPTLNAPQIYDSIV
jgi:integrase